MLLPLSLALSSSTDMATTSADVGRPSMLLPCNGSGAGAADTLGSASIASAPRPSAKQIRDCIS